MTGVLGVAHAFCLSVNVSPVHYLRISPQTPDTKTFVTVLRLEGGTPEEDHPLGGSSTLAAAFSISTLSSGLHWGGFGVHQEL